LFGNEEFFVDIRVFVIASAFVGQEAYCNETANLKVCTLAIARLLLQ
jgi:hypothetical protein